jgi:hypothetical protein
MSNDIIAQCDCIARCDWCGKYLTFDEYGFCDDCVPEVCSKV